MSEPKGARRCARCSRAIRRADLVIVDAGALFHYWCFPPNSGTDDPLHELLCRHYPSGFCANCLSTTLELTLDQVRRLVRASRSGRRLVMLLGARCAGCRQAQLTVRAVTDNESQQNHTSIV